MEEKNKYGIVLDGKMDEAVWETAQEHTNFRALATRGGEPVPVQTGFKILSCEDRIYVGIKCYDPEFAAKKVAGDSASAAFSGNCVELFLSPSGSNYEYYQFIVNLNGGTYTEYYSEGGNIRPDPYKPDWNYALYAGDDYWSVEIELPLTAFYWTGTARWSDTWMLNIARSRPGDETSRLSTWSPLNFNFHEPANFNSLGGFPMRPVRDDVCIHSAIAELYEQTEDGYTGVLKVKTMNAVADEFTFSSDHADSVTVKLDVGGNEFEAPCRFDRLGRVSTKLSLTRTEDGKEFKRHYPVLIEFEPININLTLPEYRNNFYPGQDYSKIVGTVKTAKPVTLKLEGPGIETTTITPAADGSFTFATPNFQEGEAWLTATIDGYETKKKIRRLAPSDHLMTWVSGGNIVVNGKPTLRRNIYALYYRGGTAFDRRYNADDLHETKIFTTGNIYIEPGFLIPGSENAGGESLKDQYPSAEMLSKVDAVIEKNKNRDFASYYISDEPECRGLSPVYLKHLYQYVADKDPYHVILTASRSADANVEIADWFEAHPYLNPTFTEDGKRNYEKHPNTVGGFIDKIIKLNRPDKCIGFLPTCFAYKWHSLALDYPTFDEYILHTWAAMMRGGKSLWPYAYHDLNDRPALYEGTRYIFSSFEALEDIVLFGKRTTLTKSPDAETVLYDNGAEKMFVLVNFMQESQTVTLDGLTGTWHEFRGDRVFTGNTFTLKPLETIVATNVVKGADLPTYAETAALVDQLEYERTHTGSLLLDRTADITITGTGLFKMIDYKLFDGMGDNLAGWVNAVADNFVELDLTKLKPAFRKVVLRGFEIEDAQIKFRVGDTLVDPVVTETANEEYAKTFFLADAVTPDALRFEFQGKKVELYEIEVF